MRVHLLILFLTIFPFIETSYSQHHLGIGCAVDFENNGYVGLQYQSKVSSKVMWLPSLFFSEMTRKKTEFNQNTAKGFLNPIYTKTDDEFTNYPTFLVQSIFAIKHKEGFELGFSTIGSYNYQEYKSTDQIFYWYWTTGNSRIIRQQSIINNNRTSKVDLGVGVYIGYSKLIADKLRCRVSISPGFGKRFEWKNIKTITYLDSDPDPVFVSSFHSQKTIFSSLSILQISLNYEL
ncbi:MAG: hypothetical protein JNL57_00250 [Bacteroidetes bacterium]|nr:hypothetical protein [Bacteroidota bacterium]